MKMKRVTLGFSILVMASVFILSCGKRTANVAPEADTETQSSVYASWATFVVTDIDMACSFMGENLLLNHFYIEYPGSSSGATGTVITVRDTVSQTTGGELRMAFNKTRCMDGRLRDGTIFMQFGDSAHPNAKYMRSYDFAGRLRFSNYRVDGWLIDNADPHNPAYIFNTITTASIALTKTKLTWRIVGKFKFTHPTDPGKNMIWDGELFKTLENTSNPKVIKDLNTAINWSLATVSYSGHATGTCPQIDDKGVITPNQTFNLKVDGYNPLVRDMTCSPDAVSGVVIQPTVGVSGVITIPRYEEFHPFKKGVASFTVGAKYPRQIYFGNEGEQETLPVPQCDNSGEVLIKGTSYRVDFMK